MSVTCQPQLLFDSYVCLCQHVGAAIRASKANRLTRTACALPLFNLCSALVQPCAHLLAQHLLQLLAQPLLQPCSTPCLTPGLIPMFDPLFDPHVRPLVQPPGLTPCLTPMFNRLFMPLVQPLAQSLLGPLFSPCPVCVCAQLVDEWSRQSYRVLAVATADLPHLAHLDLPRMTQQQVEHQATPFQLLGLIILSNNINSQSTATVKQLQERWVGLCPCGPPWGAPSQCQACFRDAHVS